MPQKKKSGSKKEHQIVSKDKWLKARVAFLKKEKEFTRKRDALSKARRAIPWVRVEKDYVFDSPRGKESLSDLFAGRSQLIVYHFMFAPDWDEGCQHCSFWADNFNPIGVHLNHRDVTMVVISRASVEKLEAFKKRMKWSFKWVSSLKNEFNFDYNVSFTPEEEKKGKVFYNFKKDDFVMTDREGVSVFYKDASGQIFHTYSAYARGIDLLNTAYNYLDLAPKGRDEEKLEFTQSWVRFHDRYEDWAP